MGKCLTKHIFLVIVICAHEAFWLVINVESIKNIFSICWQCFLFYLCQSVSFAEPSSSQLLPKGSTSWFTKTNLCNLTYLYWLPEDNHPHQYTHTRTRTHMQFHLRCTTLAVVSIVNCLMILVCPMLPQPSLTWWASTFPRRCQDSHSSRRNRLSTRSYTTTLVLVFIVSCDIYSFHIIL